MIFNRDTMIFWPVAQSASQNGEGTKGNCCWKFTVDNKEWERCGPPCLSHYLKCAQLHGDNC